MVVQDLAKMGLKITDLSPDIQEAIGKAGPGEATPPFMSPAGVEMMVRCDKRAPTVTAYTIPSRQQVEEQLFDQQITMLSRRYLRDLRRRSLRLRALPATPITGEQFALPPPVTRTARSATRI